MAKSKGTFGKGKTAVEQPDEFVQGVTTLGDRLWQHKKKIGLGLGVAVVGLVIYAVVDWRSDRKAEDATTAYAGAMKVVNAPVVDEDNPLPEGALPPEVSFATREEWRTASLQALSDLQGKYGDRPMVDLVDMRKAQILLEAGKLDEAQQAFERASTAKDTPEIMRLAALEGIGYCLEGKALALEDAQARQQALEQALEAFANLQPNEKAPLRDYSLFHQGRVLVALGKVDEGIAKFRQVLTEVPDSKLTENIENRIATLSMGSK